MWSRCRINTISQGKPGWFGCSEQVQDVFLSGFPPRLCRCRFGHWQVEIGLIWGFAVKGRMRATAIVEVQTCQFRRSLPRRLRRPAGALLHDPSVRRIHVCETAGLMSSSRRSARNAVLANPSGHSDQFTRNEQRQPRTPGFIRNACIRRQQRDRSRAARRGQQGASIQRSAVLGGFQVLPSEMGLTICFRDSDDL